MNKIKGTFGQSSRGCARIDHGKEFPLRHRDVLRAELRVLRETDQQYSLRKFARHLGLSHSQLSRIINGKRNLSPQAARRVGARLGFDPHVVRAFQFLVTTQSARFQGSKNLAAQALRRSPFDESYKKLELFSRIWNN